MKFIRISFPYGFYREFWPTKRIRVYISREEYMDWLNISRSDGQDIPIYNTLLSIPGFWQRFKNNAYAKGFKFHEYEINPFYIEDRDK